MECQNETSPDIAHSPQSIFQVRINLNLLAETRCLDFDECSRHSSHVRACVVECDTSRSNRIFVLIGIDACIHDTIEQVIHDFRQRFCRQFAMECANEDGLCWIQLLIGTANVVRVFDDPRNHFHIFFADPLRWDFVVIVSVHGDRRRWWVIGAGIWRDILHRAGLQQSFHLLLRLENDVHIALWLSCVVLFARPFNANLSEWLEDLHQSLFADVPRDATEKDFRRIRDELVRPARQHATPCAACVTKWCRWAVELCRLIQQNALLWWSLHVLLHLLNLIEDLLREELLNWHQIELMVQLLLLIEVHLQSLKSWKMWQVLALLILIFDVLLIRLIQVQQILGVNKSRKEKRVWIRSRLMMMMMFASLTIRSDKFGFSACDGDAASMLLSLISGEFERLKLLRKPPLSNDDRLTDESLLLNQTEHAKNERYRQTLHYPAIHKTTRELSNSPSNLLERMKCFWWSGSARCRRRHDGIESQALLGREIISLWNKDEIKANAQRQRENVNSLGKF